jgi:hypothetical protein
MQVRGAICDFNDYLPVTKTYPKHPLQMVVPNHRSATSMRKHRKTNQGLELEEKHLIWEAENPKIINAKYIPNEDLIDDPIHTSVEQIKHEKLVAAREAVGLLPE